MVLRLSISFEVEPGEQSQVSVDPAKPSVARPTSAEPKIRMFWGFFKDWIYPLLNSN